MINKGFLEPVTSENIHELKPGDWIWDNRPITRRAHKRSLGSEETVTEPIGFRQINCLDLKDFGTMWNNQPFMLGNFDKATGPEWTYYYEGRFWKFKAEQSENLSSEDETNVKESERNDEQ